MNNIECSVLINSCDKYEDAWYPFFELVKKYWPDCNYQFVLNTETKHYKHIGINLSVINVSSKKAATSWGARTKECLQQISSPYVLLLLEDFFFQKDVDHEEFEKCLQLLRDNPDLTAIYFKQIEGYTHTFQSNPDYYIMNKSDKYKNNRYLLNLQAGLWKRERLISLIDANDSPWSFEENGAERVKGKGYTFICSKYGTHSNINGCVFPYLTDRKLGYGIWAGKWLWNNDKLFQKNKIAMPSVQMQYFGKFDMLKYYFKRMKEKINGKSGA